MEAGHQGHQISSDTNESRTLYTKTEKRNCWKRQRQRRTDVTVNWQVAKFRSWKEHSWEAILRLPEREVFNNETESGGIDSHQWKHPYSETSTQRKEKTKASEMLIAWSYLVNVGFSLVKIFVWFFLRISLSLYENRVHLESVIRYKIKYSATGSLWKVTTCSAGSWSSQLLLNHLNQRANHQCGNSIRSIGEDGGVIKY